MPRSEVRRYIAVFESVGDTLIADVPISGDEFEVIRRLLGFDDTNPMYYCYPLTGTVLAEVRSLLKNRLKEGEYAYFLEASAADTGPGN